MLLLHSQGNDSPSVVPLCTFKTCRQWITKSLVLYTTSLPRPANDSASF